MNWRVSCTRRYPCTSWDEIIWICCAHLWMIRPRTTIRAYQVNGIIIINCHFLWLCVRVCVNDARASRRQSAVTKTQIKSKQWPEYVYSRLMKKYHKTKYAYKLAPDDNGRRWEVRAIFHSDFANCIGRLHLHCSVSIAADAVPDQTDKKFDLFVLHCYGELAAIRVEINKWVPSDIEIIYRRCSRFSFCHRAINGTYRVRWTSNEA